MVGKQKTITIQNIYTMMKNKQLRVPSFQRGYVWSEEQQRLFIDSILNGYYIGYMLLLRTELQDCFDIIDGQQRLKTIYYFIENGFKIQKKDQVLSNLARQEFLSQPLHFLIIDNLSETEQITNVYKLINTTGEPLSNQEIRRINVKGAFAEAVSAFAAELFPHKESLSSNNDAAYNLSFWHRLGILSKKEFLQMEDEVLIARIMLSVLYNLQQHPADSMLDKVYDETSSTFVEIGDKFTSYPPSVLTTQIKTVFDIFNRTTFSMDIFSKEGFYITFLALYDVIINEARQIDNPNSLKDTIFEINSITHKRQMADIPYKNLIRYAKFQISQNCLENDTSYKISLLKNVLENAKVETAKYEFKQGFLRLSDDRKKDNRLKQQILETLCGMANAAFGETSYLFIGIADKEADAQKIAQLDNIQPIKVADHYIVGIGREAIIMNISSDSYCAQIKDFIDKSDLSKPLQLSILSNIDIITHQGFDVVCLAVPPQKEVSFLGEDMFIRKYNSTMKVTSPREIIAIANSFL